MSSELKRLDGDHKSLRTQFTELHKRVTAIDKAFNPDEMSRFRREVRDTHQEMQQVKRELTDVRQLKSAFQMQMQEMNQLKQELHRLKSEVAPTAQISKLVQKEVQKLNSEVGKNVSDFGSMKMAVASTSRDLSFFKKEIYDSGVLNPKIAWEDHPEEHPPVGTIELGQDIFAARLLVKLGYVKARQDLADKIIEDGLPLESEDSEDPRLIMVADNMPHFNDIVSGIVVPPVEEYSVGYYKITIGWLLVCLLTMATQILIVSVIIRACIAKSNACIEHPISIADRWTLRLSKASAVVVAGTFMGRELMDSVNFAMIGELLEAGRGRETAISCTTRILTTVLIAVSNVITYLNSQSPADVFMNMTALSFIGDLGYFGLDVAKKGLLGKHVMKTMTDLNFTISLVSSYPWWFVSVHNGAVLFTAGFIASSCFVLLFVMEIPECNEDGSSPGSAWTKFLDMLQVRHGQDGTVHE